MRVVIQRANHGSVMVDGAVVGSIGKGLVLLVGFGASDTSAQLAPMAEKIVAMRIFSNADGRFDYSTRDVEGGVLAIPQFTLYADTRKGRRPEFFGALQPRAAAALFDQFVEALRKTGVEPVEAGIFGADMKVSLENDGPVTIVLSDEEQHVA